MNKLYEIAILFLLAIVGVVWGVAPEDRRVQTLLSRMTLEEKIGQMVLFTSHWDKTGPTMRDNEIEDIRQGKCGNIFNAHTAAYTRKLQKIAVEETRLGIPLLFGYDVIHGHKTIFPISLGESASWDLQAIEKGARVAAREAAASGLHWTFAPMVDITRDPRWGRVSEGAGEDPYLGSEIARARVQGFQGDDLADPLTLLACVKHYAAYGAAQAGRDYHTVDLSERVLRGVYLPPFKAAIDAGALSIMTAFNELDGVPATANPFLLKQVLRNEWGFTGFVVTDYTSINEMVAHGTASDLAQAGQQALLAGVDMDMQGAVYYEYLSKLVNEGNINEQLIDQAVGNILKVKAKLGLFEDPYRYSDEAREKELVCSEAHMRAAHDMACKSLVLLKNDNANLPLTPGIKVAVLGPLANVKRDLLGSWKAAGEWNSAATVLDGIKRNNAQGEVRFVKGCAIDSRDKTGFIQAIELTQKSDVVVMVLGESWDMSGEAACRTDIGLPGVQTDLLRAVKKTGKPVVVVLMNGRPLVLTEEAVLADAMLEAWFPGVEGGNAVADVLFGVRTPCGKLPVTFPRALGQVPIHYGMKNTGRPIDPAKPNEKYKSRYLDCVNDPLFPFGFGLSYTSFRYSDMALDRTTLRSGQTVQASVTLTNIGDFDGREIVQLYIRDRVASVSRPVKELKRFKKVFVKKDESRTVRFTLGEKDLSFVRRDMTWGAEPGVFDVYIGSNSRDTSAASFELITE